MCQPPRRTLSARGSPCSLGRWPPISLPCRCYASIPDGQRPACRPLFKFQDGRFLTRQRLVTAVRDALRSAGVQPGLYSGHSFRIGATTTAAARGVEDSVVMTLGRWRSLAYLEYIKIPRQQLARYSTMLCVLWSLLREGWVKLLALSFLAWIFLCQGVGMVRWLLSVALLASGLRGAGLGRWSCLPLAGLMGVSPAH